MAVRLVTSLLMPLRVRSAPTIVTESDHASGRRSVAFSRRRARFIAPVPLPAACGSPSLPLQCRRNGPLLRARRSARECPQALAGGGDALVGRGQRDPDVARPRPARTWSRARPGCRTRWRAARRPPSSQGPAWSPTGRGPASECSMRNPAAVSPAASIAAPGRVPGLLLDRVRVVGQRGDHRRLDRGGHDHPGLPRDEQQLLHQRGVAGHEAGPVAGQVGPLGQREHGEHAVERAAAHRLVQHRDRAWRPSRARCSTRRRRARSRATAPSRPRPAARARAAPARSGWTASSPRAAGPTDGAAVERVVRRRPTEAAPASRAPMS